MTPSRSYSDLDGQALVHEALMYRSADELDRCLQEFVAAGATAGEPVLAVLPGQNLELLRRGLGDTTAEVRLEDMTAVGHNPNCVLELYQDWIDSHEGRVRLIGELIWPGRRYAEVVECLRHEALVNHELRACPASILCPFDAERLEADVLSGAELTHPSILTGDGARRASEVYGEPVEVYAGARWPQEPARPPISTLQFTGDLRALRRSATEQPIVAALHPERRADLVFALHEAAANVIKHGNGDCAIRLWHDGAGVVTEITSGSIVTDVAVGRRRPPADALSGRGLWLINQLCDLVELRSGPAGTTLRIHVLDFVSDHVPVATADRSAL